MTGNGKEQPEPSTGRTPLYETLRAAQYRRQQFIRDYQAEYACRLIVVCGELAPYSVTLLEETLHDAALAEDLHVLLDTPGGDGESAVRMLRQAQSRCRELTLVVPNQAKSAGTLFALGADHILMGPTSDLGPVDPQIRMPDGSWPAAKAIVGAVEYAEQRVLDNPDTFEIHAGLLAEITAVQLQQARDAIGRTNALVREALAACPSRSAGDVDQIATRVAPLLIDEPQSHGANVSAADVDALGLPVVHMDPAGAQWRRIWRLWVEYFSLEETRVYEGERASQLFD